MSGSTGLGAAAVRFSWWRLLVAVLLVAALLKFVGVQRIVTVFAGAKLSVLWLAIPYFFLAFVSSALALWLLCRRELGGRVGPWPLIGAFVNSAFVALWLPGRLGDFSIAFMLRRHLSPTHGLAYVLVDKLASVAALMLCAVGGAFVYFGVPAGLVSLVFYVALWSLIFYLAGHRGLTAGVIRWLPRRMRRHFLETLLALHRLSGREYRIAVLANVAIKLLRVVFVGAGMGVLVASFGGTISLTLASLGAALVQFLTLLPVSIQGLGVQEFAYLYSYGAEHVPQAVVVLASFAARVVSMGMVSVLYLLLQGWVRRTP